ncbi:SDR family oxidoreductase [Microbacterium sp. NPDC077184]|uniref:SDR family NAD(P)-dependent oxidoreductase n=1 Tax=Microbacterium sp. NPDC077184 TaxID=3154764 RepID=UPI0034261493
MVFTGAHVKDDVVVVTGGGTGIGAAIAARYADEGARVAILGRRSAPLEEVAGATGALPVVADVGRAADARRARDTILETFGRVDTLVCNAGGPGFTTVEDADDDEWADALHANLTTAFVTAREFLGPLGATRGRIVVVSSLSGLFAGPAMAGYTTAKHALIGLTRSLARDYGARGIRVNAVCPGWVRTPMADEEMDDLVSRGGAPTRDSAYAKVTADVPLRRIAEAREIAAAVRFLGSEESSYITGATLVVDGGAHIVDLPTLAFEKALPQGDEVPEVPRWT